MTIVLQEAPYATFAYEVSTLYDLKKPLTKCSLRIQDVLQNSDEEVSGLQQQLDKLYAEHFTGSATVRPGGAA